MSAPKGKPPLPVSVSTRGYTIFGEKYPRVTSIIGCLPKPELIAWAAKSVAEFAVAHQARWSDLPADDAVKLLKGAPWSQRDAAADRGSTIHKVIESYVRSEPMPDCTEEELQVAIAAERFLLDHKPVVHAAEITVYSPTLVYAGTCDMWATIGDDPWLLDWKTGKGVYGDYAIQLTAYAIAENAIVNGADVPWNPGNGREVRMGVVHLTTNGYTLYEVKQSVELLTTVFKALQTVNTWCKLKDEAISVSSAVLPREEQVA
jgi:hypothetical protein